LFFSANIPAIMQFHAQLTTSSTANDSNLDYYCISENICRTSSVVVQQHQASFVADNWILVPCKFMH